MSSPRLRLSTLQTTGYDDRDEELEVHGSSWVVWTCWFHLRVSALLDLSLRHSGGGSAVLTRQTTNLGSC